MIRSIRPAAALMCLAALLLGPTAVAAQDGDPPAATPDDGATHTIEFYRLASVGDACRIELHSVESMWSSYTHNGVEEDREGTYSELRLTGRVTVDAVNDDGYTTALSARFDEGSIRAGTTEDEADAGDAQPVAPFTARSVWADGACTVTYPDGEPPAEVQRCVEGVLGLNPDRAARYAGFAPDGPVAVGAVWHPSNEALVGVFGVYVPEGDRASIRGTFTLLAADDTRQHIESAVVLPLSEPMPSDWPDPDALDGYDGQWTLRASLSQGVGEAAGGSEQEATRRLTQAWTLPAWLAPPGVKGRSEYLGRLHTVMTPVE